MEHQRLHGRPWRAFQGPRIGNNNSNGEVMEIYLPNPASISTEVHLLFAKPEECILKDKSGMFSHDPHVLKNKHAK